MKQTLYRECGMQRRCHRVTWFLVFCIVGSLWNSLSAAPPNIVFIFSDDHALRALHTLAARALHSLLEMRDELQAAPRAALASRRRAGGAAAHLQLRAEVIIGGSGGFALGFLWHAVRRASAEHYGWARVASYLHRDRTLSSVLH